MIILYIIKKISKKIKYKNLYNEDRSLFSFVEPLTMSYHKMKDSLVKNFAYACLLDGHY